MTAFALSRRRGTPDALRGPGEFREWPRHRGQVHKPPSRHTANPPAPGTSCASLSGMGSPRLVRAWFAVVLLGASLGAEGCASCPAQQSASWGVYADSGALSYPGDGAGTSKRPFDSSCTIRLSAITTESTPASFDLFLYCSNPGPLSFGSTFDLDWRTLPADGRPHALAATSVRSQGCDDGSLRLEGTVTVSDATGSAMPYPQLVSSDYARTLRFNLSVSRAPGAPSSSTCLAQGPAQINAMVQDVASNYRLSSSSDSCS